MEALGELSTQISANFGNRSLNFVIVALTST